MAEPLSGPQTPERAKSAPDRQKKDRPSLQSARIKSVLPKTSRYGIPRRALCNGRFGRRQRRIVGWFECRHETSIRVVVIPAIEESLKMKRGVFHIGVYGCPIPINVPLKFWREHIIKEKIVCLLKRRRARNRVLPGRDVSVRNTLRKRRFEHLAQQVLR